MPLPNASSHPRAGLGIAALRENRRILLFLAVGALNTIFGYSVFAAVYLATENHNVALLAATTIGILFNFLTTGRIVFGNRSWRALPPFVLTYAFGFALNALLLNALLRTGIDALVAQAICLPVIVVSSYAINSRLVFRARG